MTSDPLFTLGNHLTAHGYTTVTVEDPSPSLLVTGPHRTLTVRVYQRHNDGGRPWYYHDATPLAETDQVTNAVTAIKELMS